MEAGPAEVVDLEEVRAAVPAAVGQEEAVVVAGEVDAAEEVVDLEAVAGEVGAAAPAERIADGFSASR